mgnify:CR=1 FL=1
MIAAAGAQAAVTASWVFPQAVHLADAREVVEQASAVFAQPAATGGSAVSGATADYDLSACASFDSSLLAVLLELERRARAHGVSCRFVSPPHKLLALAELYGVADLLFGAASVRV